jgi:hypothetical protein
MSVASERRVFPTLQTSTTRLIIVDLLISMAEFTDLAEYTLNDEEKDLVKKLLISIENDAFPICAESAYDLSDLFGWKNAKNRKHIANNEKK